MRGIKKIASLLLALVMILSFAPVSVFAADEEDRGTALEWETIKSDQAHIIDKLKTADYTDAEDPETSLKGDVRVSIVLDAPSTLAKGYSTNGVALDTDAVNYRRSLQRSQDEIAAAISANVLGGKKLDVIWNLTLAANIISAVVPAEKIQAIKGLNGVRDVVVETMYEPQTVEVSDEPNMSVATGMTNAQYAWAQGYTGAGSLIAIVDTGLDYKHQSFDPMAFDMAITQLRMQGKDVQLLTAKDVSRVWSSLNASKRTEGSADETYFNTKVPYGFNYVDGNFNIEHINDVQGEHGSHVASIAAGNKFIYQVLEDGSISFTNAIRAVRTQGNAPDAQLLVMKVFGEGGGAYDSDYFAAIEDAIVLGADAVNLSLGSASKGFTYNSTYQDIIDSLTNVNIIWANSAGNSGTWADNTMIGYPYSDAVNLGTTGSPATYESTMSVASVDNDGSTGSYFEFGDNMIFYTESTGYGNPPLSTLAGAYEYVYVDSIGLDDDENIGGEGDDFLRVGASEIRGKIALCNRGTTSFFAKANAAAAQGAAAVVIVNNQPGTIGLNLKGYEYEVPVVSITQADGQLLKEGADSITTVTDGEGNELFKYYGGSFVISNNTVTTEFDSEYYTMSSFSSFGTTETLSIKPEITAPGGNIYAVNGLAYTENDAYSGGHDQYENMSGTSMASPQVAGMVAVLAQYYRESGLAERAEAFGLTQRQVIQSLLMSTATPLIEEAADDYYSVMSQGAGLANLDAALNSEVVVLMNETMVNGEVRKDISAYAADGKVKAELGDDPERTGLYSIEFTLNNLSDEDRWYELDAEFFTQDIFPYGIVGADGEFIVDENDEYIMATYLDTWMTHVNASLAWYVDGIKYVQDPAELDINGDDVFNDQDAQAILNFIAGTGEAGNSVVYEYNADFDKDGEITSYDAYEALRFANRGATVVPAMDSVTVRLDVELVNIDEYDDNGAYVEGFIFARESESEDGAMGVEHSIPVLGYYGSWGEASMVDVGSALEYAYGLEDRMPYMLAALGENALDVQGFTGVHPTLGEEYYLGGNPVGGDFVYKPERNAINSKTMLKGAVYSQVRNSAGYRYTLLDENGEVLGEVKNNQNAYSAYYHVNQGKWMNTTASTKFKYTPVSLSEGDKVTLEFALASEYYQDPETKEISWDEVATTWTMPFIIDNTAPEITSVFGKRIVEGDTNTVVLTVSARDNEYIAAFFAFDEDGTVLYAEPARETDKTPGTLDREDYVVILDGTDISNHIEFDIVDYAMNITAVQVNLNKEELNDPIGISLDKEEAVSVVGNSVKLNATVTPWGCDDQSVTWTSSDESIATVEDGLVTGLEVGKVTITATANADPTKSASCNVEFILISRDLKGIVWDEEGEVYFSSFDTAQLPEYTKLHEEPQRSRLASTAYGNDGTLYAASFDSETWLSSLYAVNEDDFTATKIGDSNAGYMDLAPCTIYDSVFGNQVLLGVYGYYVALIDATTGAPYGFFNFSEETGGNYFTGIAFSERYYHRNYGYTDWYYLIDESGVLYQAGFLVFMGAPNTFGVTPLFATGYPTDVPFFQSLYFDGDELYYSNFVEENDRVDLIYLGDDLYNLGSFEDQVWPVGGLYNDDVKELMVLQRSGDETKDTLEVKADVEFMSSVEPLKARESEETGILNAAGTYTADVQRLAGAGVDGQNGVSVVMSDETTAYVEITIDAAGNAADEDGNAVTHNGYYEVCFDPAAATFTGVRTDLFFNAYSLDSENGVFRFAFADLAGVAEGDEVAALMFTVNTENDSVITVKTLESEDDFEGSEEEYKFGPKHDITVVPCVSNGALDNAYSVEGNVVTVSFNKVCKVGYLEGNKYVAVDDIVANDDGSYSFTAPDDVTEVILVVKGDADLDGRVVPADTSLIQRVAMRKASFDACQSFAADVNGDGRITSSDASAVLKAIMQKVPFQWID